jgi:hypothetical protein
MKTTCKLLIMSAALVVLAACANTNPGQSSIARSDYNHPPNDVQANDARSRGDFNSDNAMPSSR